MRSLLMSLALCALFAAHGTALAQSGNGLRQSEFQITPRAGLGELRIDQFERLGFDEDFSNRDTHGIGVGFGFLTPIGIVIEAGADYFGDEDLFDTDDAFSLKQEFLSVGYQFELGDGWRLVPRVGRAHWKLRSEEGQFFEFDRDDDSREIRGDDYFYEASISRRISRVVSLGLNLKHGDYGFGRTRSAAFQITLGF